MKPGSIIGILLIMHDEVRTIKDNGGNKYLANVLFEQLSETRLRMWIVIVIKTIVTEGIPITDGDTILPEDIIMCYRFIFMKSIWI